MSAPETLEGWFAFHDLRRLERPSWVGLSTDLRAKTSAEASALLAEYESDDGPGWSLAYSLLGHKADLLLIHLRPEAVDLHGLEQTFDQSLLAPYTTRTYSYLSVIELSRHGLREGAAENVASSPYVQSRLYPQIPEHHEFICFYPMNKRREGDNNWYLLTSDERSDLMRAHGRTGRKYAGQVSQIITGSMGLDDWEWGVTLFADDPLVFKKLVYEMRFDEVSARFAEFGPFFVGRRSPPSDLEGWLNV
jgi:chlorite dismutase